MVLLLVGELQALMDAIEQRAPLEAWAMAEAARAAAGLFGTRSQNEIEKGDTPL